jgi:hypothetical protein
MVGRIVAVINKPRLSYLGQSTRGTPVFDKDGKVLGFSLLRRENRRVAGGRVQMNAIILPVADVAEIAAQAKEEQAQQ